MNNVNPLHIGALLTVVILFLFFKFSGVKEELIEAKSDFKESEKLAVEVSSLKSVYANKTKTKKALERVLANRTLKTADLSVKHSKSGVKISAKSIDTSSLNYLMGKVLNGSYNITLLKIKKLSETKASIEMEIKW